MQLNINLLMDKVSYSNFATPDKRVENNNVATNVVTLSMMQWTSVLPFFDQDLQGYNMSEGYQWKFNTKQHLKVENFQNHAKDLRDLLTYEMIYEKYKSTP
eukprot:13647515-Ditylum_brightwellii.AAC.1